MSKIALSLGTSAEARASEYLMQQGFSLVEKNFLCKGGEIDLIMYDKEVLVFVEVRYRRQNSHGSALESIAASKCRRLIRAAQLYLMRKKLTAKVSCRFDVVALDGNPEKISWIKNAFQA